MNNISMNIPRKLTKQDKERLNAAFLEMYQGLVRTNLAQRKTLGQSMYNAMTHEKMFVESKKSNDVATVYLRQIQAFYAVAQSQQSMTDPNRDKTQQFANDNARNEFMRNAETQTKRGIKSMDEIIAEFQKDMETAQIKSQQAKPVIKTARQNRNELPKTPGHIRNPQNAPQMPASQLASHRQLPMQNPHKASDYGAVRPRTAFKNGTAMVQQKGRDFENIKRLQMALIRQMQQHQRAA